MTASADWARDAFFDVPARRTLDGGTTSAGDLWHSASPRWGHSLHSMCSYQGMFPAKLAHYFIQRFTRSGDLVLDPFSGRGTTLLQARLEGRKAIANDLNPLAFVLTKAKADPPSWNDINDLINSLESAYKRSKAGSSEISPEIRMLYHENTLAQLVFIRDQLQAKPLSSWSSGEAMLAGSLAGIMHGGWRRNGTSQYLSISMPNTFSMSPTYVEKYIRDNHLEKLDQDVFECLRDKVARLYLDDVSGVSADAYCSDAATLMTSGAIPPESVDLVLTSPPYLQVMNYAQSNWIRLWLLGVEDVSRERGKGRKMLDAQLDHRHTYSAYRDFMLRTLVGVQTVLKRDGVAVIVIGDVKDPGQDNPIPLAKRVWEDVENRTDLQLVEIIEDNLPVQKKVSRIWGETKGQATSRDCALVLTRRDSCSFFERDAITWDEPWKDAGPDAAHDRIRIVRSIADRTTQSNTDRVY